MLKMFFPSETKTLFTDYGNIQLKIVCKIMCSKSEKISPSSKFYCSISQKDKNEINEKTALISCSQSVRKKNPFEVDIECECLKLTNIPGGGIVPVVVVCRAVPHWLS